MKTKTLRFSLHLLVVALVVLVFSSVASAQATRTWVSGVGDDANPCSRTAPCKTFAGAISKTAAGGIIDCLDPGGFGAVTITKSIQIDCDAGPGGVLVAGTNGIVISGAGINVELRSLNIDGLGQPGSNSTAGLNGVLINQAGTVHLVDMNIEGFSQSGVSVAVSANVQLTMEDVRIHEITSGNAIQTNATGAIVAADLNHVSISNAGSGILAQNGSRITVRNSVIYNTTVGVNQAGAGAQGSVVTVFGSDFTNNQIAFQSVSGASIGVASSVLSLNALVFNPNGGTIFSAVDNVPFQNTSNGTANGTPITKI